MDAEKAARASARALRGRQLKWRLIFGALLLGIIIATCWLWIACDGGTPSLNEYGYFATDEGYYCSGGKNAYVFGNLVSVLRCSPNTYAICPALHVMTWGAFSVFGQTSWAHRALPLLLNTVAWLAVFYFLSRRTLAWMAFTLCACCLLNPFVMVYARTASSDVLMASVVLLGYILARKKGLLPVFLGGCVFGLGLWVKESIWILVGLGLSGALMTHVPGDRLRRALSFAFGFVLSALLSWGAIRLVIYRDAVMQGVTTAQLLAVSNSSYALPNPFDLISTCKGISAFPRHPTDGLLGMWVPLFLVLPALLLLRRLMDAPVRWDGRLLLYTTFLLYALGIMILPVYYAHYFMPLIAFLPVLWLEARRDLKLWAGQKHWLGMLLMAGCLIWMVADFLAYHISAQDFNGLIPLLSMASQLPRQIVWQMNGLYILKAAFLLAVCGLWLRRRALHIKPAFGIVLAALGVAELCFSLLPVAEAYKYNKAFEYNDIFSDTVKYAACTMQAGSVILFFVVWGMPHVFRQCRRWCLLLVVLLVGGTLANPVWRKGCRELTQQNHLQRNAVAELARLVPDNAVVFGERAPQLFLSTKVRTASADNTNPVQLVLDMHKAHPDRPLFALLDQEQSYHYWHYQKAQDKVIMRQLQVLPLPSFRKGVPVGVLLVQLEPVR